MNHFIEMPHNHDQNIEESISENYPKEDVSDISIKNEQNIFKNPKEIFDSENMPMSPIKEDEICMLLNGEISNFSENNSGKEMILPKTNLETNCDILGLSKDQYDINYNFGGNKEDNDSFLSPLSDLSSYIIQINEYISEINPFSPFPQNIPPPSPSNDFDNQNSNQKNTKKEERKLNIKKTQVPKDNKLKKKTVRGRGKCTCKNSKNGNNKTKKLKPILCKSIWKFINNVISKTYNNDIGHYINRKQLLTINCEYFNNNRADFNKKLLKKTLKEIFYHDINERFTIYPKDFNKKLINRLLNEEDLKKRKIFENLFNKTFIECIDHIIGKKSINELKGLEKYFEDEIGLKGDEENLKGLLNNFEKIILSKKSRKRV